MTQDWEEISIDTWGDPIAADARKYRLLKFPDMQMIGKSVSEPRDYSRSLCESCVRLTSQRIGAVESRRSAGNDAWLFLCFR